MPKSRLVVLMVVEKVLVTSAREAKNFTLFSLRTVKKCFLDLQYAGLIEKRDGFWRRTALTLDSAAEQRGLAGYTEKLRATYKHEGEEYAERVCDSQRGRKLREMRVKTPDGAPDPVWDDEEFQKRSRAS